MTKALVLGQAAGETDTGRKRRRNEDAFVCAPPLFAVADGMGGAQAGEVASGLAAAALRGCQLGAAAESPSVTTDEPNRLAAVISGPVIMHTYLVAHPENSTISELTLWSSEPPQVPWPVISDAPVLDAITSPVCAAYIGSC